MSLSLYNDERYEKQKQPNQPNQPACSAGGQTKEDRYDRIPAVSCRRRHFQQIQRRGDINPEDISKTKESSDNEQAGKNNEKDFSDDVSSGDLDVPGSELDDEQENIGSEDEENNYYSLGGDGHNDLDEDKGD